MRKLYLVAIGAVVAAIVGGLIVFQNFSEGTPLAEHQQKATSQSSASNVQNNPATTKDSSNDNDFGL